jgi:hypothetical protein
MCELRFEVQISKFRTAVLFFDPLLANKKPPDLFYDVRLYRRHPKDFEIRNSKYTVFLFHAKLSNKSVVGFVLRWILLMNTLIFPF